MTIAAYYEGDRRIRIGAAEPVAPGAGEVQLKVSHCGICGTDLHIFHGAMDARVKMPLVMGHEMSASVHKLGAGVENFALGDKVVVYAAGALRMIAPHAPPGTVISATT